MCTSAEIDSLLESVNVFASETWMSQRSLRRAFPLGDHSSIKKFAFNAAALGKAFELELIPCKRLIDILALPFIKIATKYSAASADSGLSKEAEPEWLNALAKMFYAWFVVITSLICGKSDEVHGQIIFQPLIGAQKRTELTDALREARFPEVR